ncbi:hypothetical protein GYA49_05185 [Candidatus Beckwithbacteria bacterium]|nr:hypothetical protein [Candidatus Beckwithbacteria bacterium]
MLKQIQTLQKALKPYRKVIIWGLRNKKSNHRYIHEHFYTTLQKCYIPSLWLEDEQKNQSIVKSNDLVISVGFAAKNLPIVNNAYYCLHNFEENFHKKINAKNQICLQVYIQGVEQVAKKWNEVTYFNNKTRTLYQPWATNLLPQEFVNPVSVSSLHKLVFWIGSVWNNKQNQGNLKEIAILKKVLQKNGLLFLPIKGVSNNLNTLLIRISRLAPAISGAWQVEHNYLNCRMWKNISYGQMGFSNVKKYQEIFKGSHVEGKNIEELVENALSLSKSKYQEIIKRQQEIVKTKHTYLNRLLTIAQAMQS